MRLLPVGGAVRYLYITCCTISPLLCPFRATILTCRVISSPLEYALSFEVGYGTECRRLLLDAGADSTRKALGKAILNSDIVCLEKIRLAQDMLTAHRYQYDCC